MRCEGGWVELEYRGVLGLRVDDIAYYLWWRKGRCCKWGWDAMGVVEGGDRRGRWG